MPCNTVQGTDALLQRQQALVNLSTLQPGLPVIVIRVCSTTPSQQCYCFQELATLTQDNNASLVNLSQLAQRG